MVHGVFALEHLLTLFSFSALATAPSMSADGSWSVCTHEHLTDCCLLLCLLQRQSCQQMVHGVFALMNICLTRVLLLCASQRKSCQQMVQ
jgi:hypothetical protein